TLAEAIQDLTRLPARLKWPNDVVMQTSQGWRKVAGILTEMSAELDRTRWVVVGIGLNVNNSLSAYLKGRALALSTCLGQQLSRAALLRSFLDRFGKSYRRFEKSGFDAFRVSYWDRYSQPDEPVRLRTARGLVNGIARGVDARGALVVESKNKIKSIWEGEIVL